MEKFLQFTIIFLGTYLLLTILFPAPDVKTSTDNITISMADENPTQGNLISFTLTNNTNEAIYLGTGSPPEFVKVTRKENGEWIPLIASTTPVEGTTLQPKEAKTFSYSEQNIELFTRPGEYQIVVQQYQKEFSKTFTVSEPGFFGKIWRFLFWEPLYNGMIGALEITGKNLGWAIILLTLIVKIILFIPTQNGMEAQKKIQAVQPEIDKIKAKYANDSQKMAMETMELYKKHNIKPFASILPILLQFPVLIGLYYVIIEGLYPHNHFFLYPFLQHFDFSGIQTYFLGFIPLLAHPLDSWKWYFIPVVVAIVQFFAMKLAFANMKKKKATQTKTPEGFMGEFQNEMQKMNGVFLYVLPVIVLITTFIMPIAVGLYWFISTIFGIGQQWIVNKGNK